MLIEILDLKKIVLFSFVRNKWIELFEMFYICWNGNEFRIINLKIYFKK